MSKIKVAIVNYVNAYPFLEGLKSLAGDIQLIYEHPAACAECFRKNEVDIALVPVGTLDQFSTADYQIITDTAIGCHGEVDTVALFSNEPISEIRKVYLDAHSRTSQNLVKLLFKSYWKKKIEYAVKSIDDKIILDKNEAVLLIGDKVVTHGSSYIFKYDLGEFWSDWQRKPFVFAVWIARKKVPALFIERFSSALNFGLQKIDQLSFPDKEVYWKNYLKNNIHYTFKEKEKAAMNLFLTLIKNI